MCLATCKWVIFSLCLIFFGFLIQSEVERFFKDRTSISTSTVKNSSPFIPSMTVCHSQPYRNTQDVDKMTDPEVYQANTFTQKETFSYLSKTFYRLQEFNTVYFGKCFMLTRTKQTSNGQIGQIQLDDKKDFNIYFHRNNKISEIIYGRNFLGKSKSCWGFLSPFCFE